MTVDGILDFCETVRLEQVEDLIEQQIRCNMAINRYTYRGFPENMALPLPAASTKAICIRK